LKEYVDEYLQQISMLEVRDEQLNEEMNDVMGEIIIEKQKFEVF
jgi:hypothetical protein